VSVRDYAKPGEFYSADYLRYVNLDASASFQTMFGLIRMVQKSASDSDVISVDKRFPELGIPDISPVYRVFSRNTEKFWRSYEFSSSQTAAEIAPKAPAGTQMIVEYASIRTVANTGEAYFHNDDSSIVFGKLFISNRSDFIGANVYIPIGDGKGIYLTSTQGASKLYAAINVQFEQLRA